MTYADRLAEFVKVTGHRPGEMNDGRVSLEPPAQSAGPGRCNRYVRDKTGENYSVPCGLADGHEGGHEL